MLRLRRCRAACGLEIGGESGDVEDGVDVCQFRVAQLGMDLCAEAASQIECVSFSAGREVRVELLKVVGWCQGNTDYHRADIARESGTRSARADPLAPAVRLGVGERMGLPHRRPP